MGNVFRPYALYNVKGVDILKCYVSVLLIFIMLLSLCGCTYDNVGATKTEDSFKELPAISEPAEQSLAALPSTAKNTPHENTGKLLWPAGFLPRVPEPKGKVSSLYIDDTVVEGYYEEPQFARIEFANMNEKAADEFIEGLKAGGYVENAVYEKNAQYTKYYVQDYPTMDKGNRVIFKWMRSDKKAVVALLKPGPAALEWYLGDYFDDTGEEDLSPWPENFLPNYPRPKGKIYNVDKETVKTTDSKISYSATHKNIDVTLYYADRQNVLDCIAEMRKRYYREVSEMYTDTEIEYDGLSDFYGETWDFDQAYIYYENDRHERILKDHRSDNRWHSIIVNMGKVCH